jgi:hypothetical protein
MNTPPPTLLPLLIKAADLRAAGGSWAKVGGATGRSAETCRAWPRRYPDEWRRLYREAERQSIAEAGAEARSILRLLLRDKAPTVALKAAQLLDRGRERQIDREDQAERLDSTNVTGEILEFARFVQSVTDAELDACLARYLASRAASAGGPALGPNDPPVPCPSGPTDTACRVDADQPDATAEGPP